MHTFFIAAVLVGNALIASAVSAQTSSDSSQTATSTPPLLVVFPIEELGSCASKQACKIYCDNPEHKEACFAYAETHGLMNKAKVNIARLIANKQGPGGCSGKEECRTYCAEETHREECFAFAVQNGLRSPEDAQRNQNFQAILKSEGGPGGCTQTKECKQYCADPANTEECREFAQLHGFMRLRQQLNSTEEFGTSSPRRFGTSTRPIMPFDAQEKRFASGTPERFPKSPTSTPNFFNRPIPSNFQRPTPPPPPPQGSEPTSYIPQSFLGAAVAHFISSFGW